MLTLLLQFTSLSTKCWSVAHRCDTSSDDSRLVELGRVVEIASGHMRNTIFESRQSAVRRARTCIGSKGGRKLDSFGDAHKELHSCCLYYRRQSLSLWRFVLGCDERECLIATLKIPHTTVSVPIGGPLYLDLIYDPHALGSPTLLSYGPQCKR